MNYKKNCNKKKIILIGKKMIFNKHIKKQIMKINIIILEIRIQKNLMMACYIKVKFILECFRNI